MYRPIEDSPATCHRFGGAARPARSPVPRIVRRVMPDLEWRHVHGIALIRFLVAVWLVCLGTIVLAFGYWWGLSLYAAAGLVGWLAYEMPRWKVSLDAEGSLHPATSVSPRSR